MIDGLCASACTIVLGAIPNDKICVTPNANLAFHAAWDFGARGRTITNPGATRMLYSMYPSQVRHWIANRGGLKSAHDLSARQATGGDVSPLSFRCPDCGTTVNRLSVQDANSFPQGNKSWQRLYCGRCAFGASKQPGSASTSRYSVKIRIPQAVRSIGPMAEIWPGYSYGEPLRRHHRILVFPLHTDWYIPLGGVVPVRRG